MDVAMCDCISDTVSWYLLERSSLACSMSFCLSTRMPSYCEIVRTKYIRQRLSKASVTNNAWQKLARHSPPLTPNFRNVSINKHRDAPDPDTSTRCGKQWIV